MRRRLGGAVLADVRARLRDGVAVAIVGPRPRKRFGQHFLTDRHYLRRIVEAIAPAPGQRARFEQEPLEV